LFRAGVRLFDGGPLIAVPLGPWMELVRPEDLMVANGRFTTTAIAVAGFLILITPLLLPRRERAVGAVTEDRAW
jgi:hypothetical protein